MKAAIYELQCILGAKSKELENLTPTPCKHCNYTDLDPNVLKLVEIRRDEVRQIEEAIKLLEQ